MHLVRCRGLGRAWRSTCWRGGTGPRPCNDLSPRWDYYNKARQRRLQYKHNRAETPLDELRRLCLSATNCHSLVGLEREDDLRHGPAGMWHVGKARELG